MSKRNVLILGAGGVANVVAHKCAQNNDRLGDLHIASRTLSKCEDILESLHRKKSLKTDGVLQAHQVDGMKVEDVSSLIRKLKVEIVVNVGSAFINMSVLEACLQTGAAYLDTAIHEDPLKICETPPWYANYEWKRKERCREAGVTAVLGAGFDPGMVNAYAAYAVQNCFDSISSIDIMDVNAGNHGRYFATNFDPEINFREFTGTVYSWQGGKWCSNHMFEKKRTLDFPEVGERSVYLSGHDEIHSLSQNLNVPDIRFWMGFGDHYINVFTVLKNLGLLSEQPVTTAEGLEVVPLKVVKAVLPDPNSLAPGYTGKTCIGDQVRGIKDGKEHEVFIYNTSSHEAAYAEVESQGISFTAAVPAVAGALAIADGAWDVGTMANVEELPVAPFLKEASALGLPTRIRDDKGDRPLF